MTCSDTYCLNELKSVKISKMVRTTCYCTKCGHTAVVTSYGLTRFKMHAFRGLKTIPRCMEEGTYKEKLVAVSDARDVFSYTMSPK